MAGKSKKTKIVTFRLNNEDYVKLKMNHPQVSEYLRERTTYDIRRKHRRKGQT